MSEFLGRNLLWTQFMLCISTLLRTNWIFPIPSLHITIPVINWTFLRRTNLWNVLIKFCSFLGSITLELLVTASTLGLLHFIWFLVSLLTWWRSLANGIHRPFWNIGAVWIIWAHCTSRCYPSLLWCRTGQREASPRLDICLQMSLWVLLWRADRTENWIPMDYSFFFNIYSNWINMINIKPVN